MVTSSNGHHHPMGLTSILSGIRRATRLEVALGAGLLIIAVGTFAAEAAAGSDNPRSVAVAYLQAQARQDAAAVSALSSIERSSAPAADYYLLDTQSLKAALAATGIQASTIQADEARSTGSLATVNAGYMSSSGQQRTSLTLVRQQPLLRMHPTWAVRVTPALLKVKALAIAGDPLVDGHRLVGAAGKAVTVEVFPGTHTISSQGSELVTAVPTKVEAEAITPAGSDLQLKLTQAGVAASAKAVDERMTSCLDPNTTLHCPQDWLVGLPGITEWKLVGDPAADATYTVGADGSVLAKGHVELEAHFKAAFYDESWKGYGGAFAAHLVPSSSGLKVDDVVPDNGSMIQRPAAASDAVVIAAVSTSLLACIQGSQPLSTACPTLSDYGHVSKAQWQLPPDPTSGAKVSYDQMSGLFLVSGSGMAHVEFEGDGLFTFGHHSDTYKYVYQAQVLWDGAKPVVVGSN